MTANAGPATEADEPQTIPGPAVHFPRLNSYKLSLPSLRVTLPKSPLNDRHFAEGAA